jgi:methyl-accepting chemotaxis protein
MSVCAPAATHRTGGGHLSMDCQVAPDPVDTDAVLGRDFLSMSLFRRLSIRARLISVSLLAGTALLAVSGVALQSIGQFEGEFDAFKRIEYADQAHLAALQLQLGLVLSHEKDALLNFDDADAGKRFKSRWQLALRKLRVEIDAVRASLPAPDRFKLDAALGDYEREAGDVIQRGINGQIVTATEANQALAPARERLRSADPVLDDLARRIHGAAAQRQERVTSAGRLQAHAIVLVTGAALLLFAPAMWWISISITRPLDRAVRMAEQIAQGDLATPLRIGGRDEVAHLMSALASMQASLAAIVSQVRSTSESISSASAEIAAGSADLSTRTDSAAVDLQRTTSNMQDLTALVSQAEHAARTATERSGEAVASAREGGHVVVDVARRMNGIAQTSHRISDIIALIDGIAFQTNLLALNAAVEAARAGAQGRGFAVVAAEVRSLAQRTSRAATEIKQLVAGSVDEIDAGASRAQLAGRSMSGIIDAIEALSGTMRQLCDAAAEQSRDIVQANGALRHLEAMTQQNAALVQQSSASAHALQSHAGELQQLVHRFRLD